MPVFWKCLIQINKTSPYSRTEQAEFFIRLRCACLPCRDVSHTPHHTTPHIFETPVRNASTLINPKTCDDEQVRKRTAATGRPAERAEAAAAGVIPVPPIRDSRRPPPLRQPPKAWIRERCVAEPVRAVPKAEVAAPATRRCASWIRGSRCVSWLRPAPATCEEIPEVLFPRISMPLLYLTFSFNLSRSVRSHFFGSV